MTYLVDFDLDGDTCECGKPVAKHPPLKPVKPWSQGRPCERMAPLWRGNGEAPAWVAPSVSTHTPPHGVALQINRPRSR